MGKLCVSSQCATWWSQRQSGSLRDLGLHMNMATSTENSLRKSCAASGPKVDNLHAAVPPDGPYMPKTYLFAESVGSGKAGQGPLPWAQGAV